MKQFLSAIKKFRDDLVNGVLQERNRRAIEAACKKVRSASNQEERDDAAQMLDKAMRGNSHYEAARKRVIEGSVNSMNNTPRIGKEEAERLLKSFDEKLFPSSN